MNSPEIVHLYESSHNEEPLPLDSTSQCNFSDQEKKALSCLFNSIQEDETSLQISEHKNHQFTGRLFFTRNQSNFISQQNHHRYQHNYLSFVENRPFYEIEKNRFSSSDENFFTTSINVNAEKRKQDSFSWDSHVMTEQSTTQLALPNSKITEADVLFGRGKGSNNHAGNAFFRMLVSSMANKYKTSSRLQKTALSWDIVQLIKSRGGRFLCQKPGSDAWVEMKGRVLRRKTSQALRDCYTREMKANH